MKQRDLLLKNILKIYVGKADKLPNELSHEEWGAIFNIAKKQTILGVTFDVIKGLPKVQLPPKEIKLKWLYFAEKIKQRNIAVNEAIYELQKKLNDVGLNGCILKGQGVGLLYPTPESRQPGDIDVWCNDGRNDIIGKLKDYKIKNIVIHHADIDILKGVPVELHFVPSWFYCPFTERKFRKWYVSESDRQFENCNDKGFCNPTISFNLVYSIVHIYKHLFDEGIGLRQLMDYYFILLHSDARERNEALGHLSNFKMKRFAGAVMYVMQEVFGLDSKYYICSPSEKYGKQLLADIMAGGNFGQYNIKNVHGKENVITRGIRKMKRNLKVVAYYPSEVLWSPIWKCWHWVWRKRNGYL